MTKASIQALEGIRDLSTLQWYAIPLLSLVFYIYITEIKKARDTGDWNAVLAGVAIFGADFFNETWNGWILVLSGRSALWTAPGPTALRTMVGWNIEIMYMFAILGIVWFHSLSGKKDEKILGIPEKIFWGLGYSVIAVAIELALNAGGLLVWEYRFWERTLIGVPLIFLIGYFWFFLWATLAVTRRTTKAKLTVVITPYVVAIVMNLIAAGLGWKY